MTMNIRAKINELVHLQDCITHLVENSPPGGTDKHQAELTKQISNRTLLANEIVEYVMRLEERVAGLELIVADDAFTFRRVNND